MFTSGRIVFLIIFIVLFIAGMIYAYRKDLRYEKLWYGGVWKILLGIILIAFIYFLFSRI